MSSYSDIIPLLIVHIVLIDAQLSASQGHARHLILQRGYLKGARNDMMQKQLQKKNHSKYSY